MADTYDKTSRLEIAHEDLEQAKFGKNALDKIIIRVLSELVGLDGVTTADVTLCNQLEVNEGVRNTVLSDEFSITVGSPQEIKVGASNLTGRTSILIQAKNSDFNFGFEETELIFTLTKGNFFEVKLPAGLSLWAAPTSGNNKKLAAAELK